MKLSRQRPWGVALVRADRHAIHELLISIGRVNDVRLIRHGQRGERVVSPELVAPGTADGVGPTNLARIGLSRGRPTIDGVGARRFGPGVDGEGDVAGLVVGGAGAGKGLDGP